MNKLSRAFKDLLRALTTESVEYLLVGGYAVAYYGYNRPIRDLDIWIGTRHENAVKISRVIHSWVGESTNFPPELFEHPNRIIRFSFPMVNAEIVDPILGQKPEVLYQFQVGVPEQIEILTIQTGVEFYECFANRVVDTVDEIEVNLISLQDLKKIKQTGDRSKDLADLAHLA